MSHKLYPEHLLQHVRSSRYRGEIAHPDAQTHAQHPSCGDRVSYTIRYHDGRIQEIAFQAVGCMLSQAAASLVAEMCIHKSIEEVRAISDEELLAAARIEVGPNRLQCLLLPLHAVRTS